MPCPMPRGRLRRCALLALAIGAAGCRPTRTLVVDSVPQGAVVRLDETVIGRTPLEYRFDHYGERRVSLYAPGYRTHSARESIRAPWHARFPLDLFTEVLLPLGLDHRVVLPTVVLEADSGDDAAPATGEFVARAGEVRATARAEAAARRPLAKTAPAPELAPELVPEPGPGPDPPTAPEAAAREAQR